MDARTRIRELMEETPMERVPACTCIRAVPVNNFEYFQKKHGAIGGNAGGYLRSHRHFAGTVFC